MCMIIQYLECLVSALAADVFWEFAETKHQEPTPSSVVKQELRQLVAKFPAALSTP